MEDDELKLVQAVADLITQSQRTEGSSNCWTLIKNPEQTDIDGNGTPLPITPYKTGYKDASVDTLTSDVRRRVPEYVGLLTPRTFAILDERSARDQTVLLVHEFETMPDDGLEEDGGEEENEENLQKEWKQFRVNFVGSWEMMAQLEEAEETFLEAPPTEDDYDENGVYQVQDVRMKPGQ